MNLIKYLFNLNWDILLKISLIKTIKVNFLYLPFSKAICLPILISRKTLIRKPKYYSLSKIVVNNKIKFGLVKIGFGDCTLFDKYKSRTILLLNGLIVFNGKTFIGHGSKIICLGGQIHFGNNFEITAETTIVSKNKIVFGDNCLLSWDVLIMDSDSHYIFDYKNEIMNADKQIEIGDKVWIGCRTLILKGSKIGKNNIIAAGSIISGKHIEENSIIGNKKSLFIKDINFWEK